MKSRNTGYYGWIIYLTAIIIFCTTGTCRVFAANGGWKDVSSGIDKTVRISCVRNVKGTDTLYAGTSDGLYRTTDLGKKWVRLDLPGEKICVTRIDLFGGEVFVSSLNGLYIGRSDEWKWLPGKQGLVGVAICGSGIPLVWTGEEMFLIEKDMWQRIDPQTSQGSIDDAAFKEGFIYTSSGGRLFYSSDMGMTWDRRFLSTGSGEEVPDYMNGDDDQDEVCPVIRRIDVSGPDGVTVATGEGIFFFSRGEFSSPRIDTAGLPAEEVIFALNTGKRIFAATRQRVFVHDLTGSDGGWRTVFEKYTTGNVVWLELMQDAFGGERLWVATENGVYTKDIRDMSGKAEHLRLDRNNTGDSDNYPTILDVQRMAIEYAEVSPEKIKKWREGAKWKAVMPRVSLSFSESNDENVELYKSSTNYYVATGPNETGTDWSIDLTWDLADVVWNDAQTSIDVRSKLMVQLRDDILEEVTRIYFERERILEEIKNAGDFGEELYLSKKIRIEELTAYIDLFTGGGFSAAMLKRGSR